MPERVEMLLIIAQDREGQEAWVTHISREDGCSPRLSEWEQIGDGGLLGRFPEALAEGIK